MSYDLRPLSLAELLDRAFSLYRRHFLLFVGIMALPSVAMLIVAILMQFMDGPAPAATGAAANPEEAIGLIVLVFGAFVLMMILYWITYAVALGASTAAVAEIYKAQPATIAGAYGAMRGRIGRLAWLLLQVGVRLFGVLLLVGAAAALGGAGFGVVLHPALGIAAMVLIFGGGFLLFCWMALRYAIVVPPAVLEDHTASESIARSVELTYGNRWRVLVLLIFTGIVNYAGLMLFQWPFLAAAMIAGPETTTGFWLNLSGAVTGAAASAVTSPLAVVAMAVLYYDLRIRKEGLDLEIMIAGLGGDSTSAPPPDAGGRGYILPG